MSDKMDAKNSLNITNGDNVKKPFLIGVAGGTASGKSTVCKKIMTELGQTDMDHTERQVVTISQDSFYRELTPPERAKAARGLYNFDHPDAFNDQLMYETLVAILNGVKVELPSYDYRSNSLDHQNILTIYPADVVLFEGILVFYFPKILDLFHMKLFVDTDSDTRLARRVPRDINERGRDLDTVLTQYMKFVKPAFEEFCSPTKKFADVIIPRGADNTVAIDLIVRHIGEILKPGSSANNTCGHLATTNNNNNINNNKHHRNNINYNNNIKNIKNNAITITTATVNTISCNITTIATINTTPITSSTTARIINTSAKINNVTTAMIRDH